MTVLVTGASGFVGLNIVEHLLVQGEPVVALADRPPPSVATEAFGRFGSAYRAVLGDVRDEAGVLALLKAHGIRRVLHAAAITSSAAREQTEGARVIDVNLVGLAAVASAAVAGGVERLVLVGSNAIFGGHTRDGATLDEDSPLDPGNLYALSKATGEAVLAQYGRHHGLDGVVGRLAGVFGPWEYRTGLRDTMNPVFQATGLAFRGGRATLPRPGLSNWHFSRDAAASLCTLLLADAHRHAVYNLGTPFVWSIADWCARLADRFPAFSYAVGAESGTPVDLYGARDGGLLSGQRFNAEFGPTGVSDLDAAFEHTLTWLDRLPGFGPREGASA